MNDNAYNLSNWVAIGCRVSLPTALSSLRNDGYICTVTDGDMLHGPDDLQPNISNFNKWNENLFNQVPER